MHSQKLAKKRDGAERVYSSASLKSWGEIVGFPPLKENMVLCVEHVHFVFIITKRLKQTHKHHQTKFKYQSNNKAIDLW